MVICYVASTAVCRAVVVYEQGAQRAGWMPVPSVQAVLTCASQRRLPAQLLQLRDGVQSTGLLHVAAARRSAQLPVLHRVSLQAWTAAARRLRC